MNPIEFGTNLFAKAKEMQTKTVRACDVIVKIDEELNTIPEQFKMDFMCLVTRAVDKCENMNNKEAGKWIDDKCSVCGKGIEDLISSSEWYINEKPNFCPFCGCKMQEVEE